MIDKGKFHDVLVAQAERHPGRNSPAGYAGGHPNRRYLQLLEDAGFVECDFTVGNPQVRATAAGYAAAQVAAARNVNAFDLYVESLFGMDRSVQSVSERPAAATNRPAFAEIRERHAQAYERWSPEDDRELLRLHEAGQSTADLAERFERQPNAIRSRLQKLAGPRA